MSKAITFNEDIKLKILKEVAEKLEGYKSVDGKFSFSTSVAGDGAEEDISISMTPAAYLKMLSLVAEFTSEVAWHGTVERNGNHFSIKDIFVYPQVVTGVTVTPDQVEYTNWLYDLPDEDFNALRFHGHSHVNMTTSPSGTDIQFQTDMLAKLTDDDYYIFVIWNKRGDFTFRVYDLATNSMYDNSDIDFYVEDVEADLFIADAKKMVVSSYAASNKNTKVDTHSSWWNKYHDGGYHWNATKRCYEPIEEKKTEEKEEIDSAFYYGEDDYDNYNFLRGEGWV